MQFTVMVNQTRALEWGLNAQQAMLFAFLYQVPSWADTVMLDFEVYYHISKSKVIAELPLLTDKPDTVYRIMRSLHDAGLIELATDGQRTLMQITELGSTWNMDRPGVGEKSDGGRKNIQGGSEKYPRGVGEKSDRSSNQGSGNQKSNNQGQTNTDTAVSGDQLPDPVRSLFDHWVYVMGKDPSRTRLTNDRRRKIQARLKEYSFDECRMAINGCASSDFHMGRHPNTNGKKYNGIDIIFRNGEKLEGFRDMAEGSGSGKPPEFPS